MAFETFQESASMGEWLTKSGFSQDDLVSNLIGFYIGIGKLDRMKILKTCHPVSDETAQRVAAVLVKSETSSDELLDTLRSCLDKASREAPI